MMSPLECQSLTTGYDRAVVFNADLALPANQLSILIGANGCGKSTLLKAMARSLPAQQGQVLLNGDDIHRLSTKAVAQKLGYMPQSPIAPEGLRVRDLVTLGRFPHQSLWRSPTPDDERLVHEAMQMTDVLAFADRPVDQLSGGQRQRCWIAMALAQQTDILLLDEPTTYLDLKVQVELMQLLQRLSREQGRTMAIVLHELNLAAAFADHLVMMKAGRIKHQGAPETIFTPDNLLDVFDLNATVYRDPMTDRPFCQPCMMPPNLDSTTRETLVAETGDVTLVDSTEVCA
ncbi:MAG: ABC transporter ATP-binding protein [Reinekea sp.]|nr:ABC transporter ATP-binding protein [Reinekea sp.]